MNCRDYADSLFASYAESEVLSDFKAELASNLEARIAALVKKGRTEDEAFSEAVKELEGVSKIADELSLKKKQEVLADGFFDTRNYITPPRAAAYAVFCSILIIGIACTAITWFTVPGIVPALGVITAFLPISAAGLSFLGLTQESSYSYPMTKKRAGLYTAAIALILLGITTAVLTWFAVTEYAPGVWPEAGGRFGATFGIMLLFCVPAIALFVFLGLTERPREKPWVMEKYAFTEASIKASMEKGFNNPFSQFSSPASEARFGMFCGALWIAAVGVFLLLGFNFGFSRAWLVFIFTVAIQLVVQGVMTKKRD